MASSTTTTSSTTSTTSSTSSTASTTSTTSSTSSTASTTSSTTSTSSTASTSSTTSSTSTTTTAPPDYGEIWHNTTTGLTLYAARFEWNGQVFLTDGSSYETWGAAGHDADDYDVEMNEVGVPSGHYVGQFDASDNIPAGVYRIAIYQQIGANPADSDPAIAQGELYWDGDQEITDSLTLDRLRQTLGAWR